MRLMTSALAVASVIFFLAATTAGGATEGTAPPASAGVSEFRQRVHSFTFPPNVSSFFSWAPLLTKQTVLPPEYLSETQQERFWGLLHPQDGRGKPADKHPGVGHFDRVCLMVNRNGGAPPILVDKNGIVSDGPRYFKLTLPERAELRRMFYRLWYTKDPGPWQGPVPTSEPIPF